MNSTTLNDFEIMAPVGSRESLAAAIQAGADSIYFGIENLNMRARSANTFTIDDLREIAQTCDEHGMKSYLTVNTIIYDNDMSVLAKVDGEYGNFKAIYQEYTELPKDAKGESYQAGVFFAYEGCGLGFRRGGLIMENFSKFVGHRIKD